jgi:hypothetical protein
MHCYFVDEPRVVGPHTPDEECAFKHADTTFTAAILSVLGDTIVDAYVPLQTSKEIWDGLEAKYGVSDAGSELYVTEQFHDYKMVDDHSTVEQAHEIQTLVKELKFFGCVLHDKFVAGCIIAKLPQVWTDFATSLKHKRQEFGIAELIGSLDVEEKARAKDVHDKKIGEGSSSAHVVQKNPPKFHKKKLQRELKQKSTTPFKKKKNKEKGNCFTCGKPGNYARECEETKWKPNKKTVNTVEIDAGTVGYSNLLPTVFQFAIHLIGTLIQVQIYMCVLMFLCFLLIRSGGLPPC